MAVIDLWYKMEPVIGQDGKPVVDSDGKPVKTRVPSKRHNRGRRWRVEVEGAPTESFTKLPEARDREAEIISSMRSGRYVDPRDGRITVYEYAQQWLSTLVIGQVTSEKVESFFRLHVDGTAIGDMSVADVRTSHVQAWVKDRSDILAGSTLSTSYPYLVAMFARLDDDGVIAGTPCKRGVQLPGSDSDDKIIPTTEQVLSLDSELRSRFGPLALTAASTGLRASELFGLTRSQVDLKRQEINVIRQMKRTAKHGVHIGAPKTKTSRRCVEIPDGLVQPLREHLSVRREPVRLWYRADRRETKHREDEFDLVFRRPDGKPLHNGLMHYTWHRALERAGIDADVGMHSLRHYFATVLIHGGANVKTVQLALGHSTPTITMNTYLHDWPDAVDRTRNLVQSALFGK